MNEIINVIKQNDTFNIFMHVSPDGDTIGSAVALHAALLLLGKKSTLICDDQPAAYYNFLYESYEINQPEKVAEAPVAIAIDCADFKRMGRGKALFEKSAITINIDHHLSNPEYAKYNHVEGNASSTGEIISDFIKGLSVPFNLEIATNLFAAISTDTGSFAYSNTTAKCLRLAAEFIEIGIDVARLSSQLMNSRTLGKTRLLSTALSKLELFYNEKIGLIFIELCDLAALGVKPEDCESIVDYIRDIDTVEVAIFIREMNNNKFKVSLRSKLYADVGSIAQVYGGGGHVRAAGFAALGEYNEIKTDILSAAEGLLNE